MILTLRLIEKELYSAALSISGGAEGYVRVKGRFGSHEAEVTVDFGGVQTVLRRDMRNPGETAHRLYGIWEDGADIGCVYKAYRKTGFLSSYEFLRMNLQGEVFTMYLLSMGKEGGKSPILYQDRQIAQINKASKVIDGKHEYTLFVERDSDAILAVLFGAYLYATGAFAPGETIKKGVSVTYGSTRRPELLEKYDPTFESRC